MLYRKMKSRVAQLRETSGLTQVELAAFIGVTPNTIQNWEKDDGLAQLERYLKLAEIFDCQVADLIEYVVDESDSAYKRGFSIDDLRELRKKWNLPAKNQEQDHQPVEGKLCKEEA